MARPGRKPVSPELHVQRGTWRPDRHGPVTGEPARRNSLANAAPPPCPRGLSKPSRQLWTTLTQEWLLSADALAVLHGGLQARDLAQKCLKEVERDGVTYLSETGLRKANPSVGMARDLLAEFRASLRQLRLPEEE
jgi:hypothetical protein